MSWYGYRPYVPVARRRAQAAQEVARRLKNGEVIAPIRIAGRKITSTFWGEAWCTNLEGYSDYANRLPRGRTYVRNGSVIDLKIERGRVDALVSGSDIYEIRIDIDPLSGPHWQALKAQCAGQIGSLVELLQGRLSKGVMELVTDRDRGLFPKPKEITMRCSCPDYAGLCKHLAAVMYGIGHRLDNSPELLFLLRGVDHSELIEQAIPAAPSRAGRAPSTIAADDLGDIFGIDLGDEPAPPTRSPSGPKRTRKAPAPKKAPAAKQSAASKKAPAAKKKATAKEATVTTKKAAPKKSAATKKTPATTKAAAATKATATTKAAAAKAAAAKEAAAKEAAAATKASTVKQARSPSRRKKA